MTRAAFPRSLLRATLAAGLALAAAGAPVAARAGPAVPQAPAGEGDAFFDRVAAAWSARDAAAWLALWDFASPDQRASEEGLLQAELDSDETTIERLGASRPSASGGLVTADFQLFTSKEPRAHVAYWRLVAHERAGRLALVARVQQGEVEGLVHLTLADESWRVRGISLQLPDFELRLEDGTLFANPESLGPTALVFVGDGKVRFDPRPKAEREQLRQFSGSPSLEVAVRWAFVRLHPVDFRRLVDPARLERDPQPALRRAEAERVFRARAERSFVVDAALPRSPWWLMPGVGDTVVDFPWRRNRVLTFAVSGGEGEDVNLFDRDRRIQVCVYSSAGRAEGRDAKAPRALDLLDQELAVRFEPERLELAGVHAMTLRPLRRISTLRLRLHDDLRVSSVATPEGTGLLFLRVREQGSIVVSLGSLAEREAPFTLVTRYAGRHDPAPIDHEVLQVAPPTTTSTALEEVVVDRPPLVYSNRSAWYPRLADEDFTPTRASFDTPEGWLGVTGGELVSVRSEAKRTRALYRLAQPGKFVTAVVGRLSDVGLRQQGEQSVRTFATPRARSAAEHEVQLCERILAFYAERFGPCPYPFLNLVVTEASAPGGHSPPGLVYLQRRPPMLAVRGMAEDPSNFSDQPGFFLAHELAHQWWGQASAPAGYRERWLSEAWAQYAAVLWIREQRGEAAFRGMMDRMARWAMRHDPLGPIDLGQRLGVLLGDQRVFRATVYDKGAWVIHMLRGIVGDDAFFRGARAFLDEHRFAKVDTGDLRQALERASGRDLRPYFERWVFDTGLPLVQWMERGEATPGGYRTTVTARAQGAPGPLPLDISFTSAAGRQTRRVLLESGDGSWTFETAEKPRRVSLNEGRSLLARFERLRRLPERPQR